MPARSPIWRPRPSRAERAGAEAVVRASGRAARVTQGGLGRSAGRNAQSRTRIALGLGCVPCRCPAAQAYRATAPVGRTPRGPRRIRGAAARQALRRGRTGRAQSFLPRLLRKASPCFFGPPSGGLFLAIAASHRGPRLLPAGQPGKCPRPGTRRMGPPLSADHDGGLGVRPRLSMRSDCPARRAGRDVPGIAVACRPVPTRPPRKS